MTTRLVFHTGMAGTRTIHALDPWYRQLEYIITITDQGPSALQDAEPPLDRSWDIRVDVRYAKDANALCYNVVPQPQVKAVTITQYCSMQEEPFYTHNNSLAVLSKVSSVCWETRDFVQRPNDYIHLCVERYVSPAPEELVVFV